MNLLHLRKYLSIFAGKMLCRRGFLMALCLLSALQRNL